jgi:hydrogenase maturation protein HypF
LARAAAALRSGRIVAVKGLGGFHLMCDAIDVDAVARLRERKPRLEKPLALMVRDLGEARALCHVSEAAERALVSPEAPIVLLERRDGARVAPNVAPGYPSLGLMLPATPLHHLLLRAIGRPVVATSGNAADEPIATDEHEARNRLAGIADLWLVHDRSIERHMDDSVGWILDGRLALLRRARGFAPLAVRRPRGGPTLLAVGGHLKNTIALGIGRQVLASQHIGDLDTPEAIRAFENVIADLLHLTEARPEAIAHDLSPDYVSTQWALRAAETLSPRPRLIGVQHHHAHLAACLAEHDVEGPALGVTWDGTGYATDGTVWGGEFLLGDASGYRRVAHLSPFRLPGSEVAVREPRRVALGLLWELFGEEALDRTDLEVVASFGVHERRVLGTMLARGVNAPLTTSAGRLFDGVAALLGLATRVTFEGQAAAALEFAAETAEVDAYPYDLTRPPAATGSAGAEPPAPSVLDWRPMLRALLAESLRGEPRQRIAARFHATLIEGIAAVARAAGAPRVALTGGCFQNRMLVERTAKRLRRAGHEVLVHRLVPPNDGGVSFGQLAVATARLAAGDCATEG